MENVSELPHNAVTKLILHGLATNSEQSPVPLSLPLGNRVSGIIYHHPTEDYNIPALPPIPCCNLPPSANLDLELTLGEKISDGATGLVYKCTVEPTCSAATSPYYIPPLAIKIAAPFSAHCTAREAWFYKEMESVQGILIPRCYGFFVGEVPDGHQIPAWDDFEEPFGEQRDAEEHEEYPFVEEFVKPDFDRRLVSILVLEELGPHLPLYQELSEDTRKDIADIFEELSSLGIVYWDIRAENVLSVPSSPPALPGLPSSRTKRVYGWRVIDLDRVARTLADPSYLQRLYSGRGLRGLLFNGVVPDTEASCYC